MEQRDDKGKFLPGNDLAINADIAREYQLRAAESRKHNTLVRDAVLHELAKSAGGGLTRLDVLVAKAAHNHLKGKLTFKDIKDIQEILGEAVQNIDISHDVAINLTLPADATAGLQQALKTGAQPRKPKDE